MDNLVKVSIPVEPEAAEALANPRNRDAMGRPVSRVLRPKAGPSALARAIAATKAEARAAGLMDTDIDEELAAYNAERRAASAASLAFSQVPMPRLSGKVFT